MFVLRILPLIAIQGFRLVETSSNIGALKQTLSKLLAAGLYAMILPTRDLFITHLVQLIISWLGDIPNRFRTKYPENLSPKLQFDLIISRIVCEELFLSSSTGVTNTAVRYRLHDLDKSDGMLWDNYAALNSSSRLDCLILLNFRFFIKQRMKVLSFLNQAFINFPEYKIDFGKLFRGIFNAAQFRTWPLTFQSCLSLSAIRIVGHCCS